MHPSVRCLWGVCSPSVTATSVRTSTSNTVATRPVVVEAAVCAQLWLTTRIFAPNMESTLISDRKSLNAVSDYLLGVFFNNMLKLFQNKILDCNWGCVEQQCTRKV